MFQLSVLKEQLASVKHLPSLPVQDKLAIAGEISQTVDQIRAAVVQLKVCERELGFLGYEALIPAFVA